MYMVLFKYSLVLLSLIICFNLLQWFKTLYFQLHLSLIIFFDLTCNTFFALFIHSWTKSNINITHFPSFLIHTTKPSQKTQVSLQISFQKNLFKISRLEDKAKGPSTTLERYICWRYTQSLCNYFNTGSYTQSLQTILILKVEKS